MGLYSLQLESIINHLLKLQKQQAQRASPMILQTFKEELHQILFNLFQVEGRVNTSFRETSLIAKPGKKIPGQCYSHTRTKIPNKILANQVTQCIKAYTP